MSETRSTSSPDATPNASADTPSDSDIRIQAAVYRRLRDHLLQQRPDVQNIDLMILAGFCRNCLSDWYRDAAAAEGITMQKGEARDHFYGEPFADWKAKHQREASPEQLAAFADLEASKPTRG